MALIRFEQLDPVSNMLALQQELDRFRAIRKEDVGCPAQVGVGRLDVELDVAKTHASAVGRPRHGDRSDEVD